MHLHLPWQNCGKLQIVRETEKDCNWEWSSVKKRHTHSISLCPIVSPLPGCLCTWQPAPTARPLQMAAKVASSWRRRSRRALISQGRCLAQGGPGQGQEPAAILFQVLYTGFWAAEQVLALICTFWHYSWCQTLLTMRSIIKSANYLPSRQVWSSKTTIHKLLFTTQRPCWSRRIRRTKGMQKEWSMDLSFLCSDLHCGKSVNNSTD